MNVLEMFSLKGRVALVTGGAGSYGRQIVEALAEAGARVCVASRNLDALERLAATHRSAGHEVFALRMDQGDESSVLACRDELLERAGRLDVLVNNAVLRPSKGWKDNAATFEASMRVNATGLFVATRAFGEVMEKQRSGSIINIGSIFGMVGLECANYEGTEMHGWYPDYFFNKGGMINFTRFCASYFGRVNVRVNCISPGGLYSPSMPEPFVRQYSARTQLGRLAGATDLKGAVVFFASDASAYVTGVNLPLDGGYSAK